MNRNGRGGDRRGGDRRGGVEGVGIEGVVGVWLLQNLQKTKHLNFCICQPYSIGTPSLTFDVYILHSFLLLIFKAV